MVLTKKRGPAGFDSGSTAGAAARGVMGIRPDEPFGADDLGKRPGPVGVNDTATQTALFLAGGKGRKGATRRSAKLKMKVEIIEHQTKSIFSHADRKNISAAVNSELKRIRRGLKKSKAQFTVSWTQPRKLSPSVATPRVLQVYVIENTQNSIQQAIKIRNAVLPGVKGNDQELANHVAKEAGFNAKKVGGNVSVSFVSITRAQQYKQRGVAGIDKIFANIILHEIGHGMDAEHSDRGVMTANTVYGSTGGQLLQYSKASVKKIDKFLSGI